MREFLDEFLGIDQLKRFALGEHFFFRAERAVFDYDSEAVIVDRDSGIDFFECRDIDSLGCTSAGKADSGRHRRLLRQLEVEVLRIDFSDHVADMGEEGARERTKAVAVESFEPFGGPMGSGFAAHKIIQIIDIIVNMYN